MTEERLKKIVKLSEEQYNTLKSTGTVTIEGKVLTYSPTDTIYVTPTLKSFTDVIDESDKVPTSHAVFNYVNSMIISALNTGV